MSLCHLQYWYWGWDSVPGRVFPPTPLHFLPKSVWVGKIRPNCRSLENLSLWHWYHRPHASFTYESDQNATKVGHSTDFSFWPASTATTPGLVFGFIHTPQCDEPSLRTILTSLLYRESVRISFKMFENAIQGSFLLYETGDLKLVFNS